ncbi:MAG: SGNH/GDSL hydrolase family protein [Oscillospiraceae bacterium]|jgi:lysophospholipase L1-like esterase
MAEKVKAFIYGDSIMRGTVVDESLRYHSIVGGILARLAAMFGIEFKNRAHFGLTIEKGKRLLEKDMARGLKGDYAVVEYGGNDCSYNWDAVAADPTIDHRPFTEPERFQAVCVEMVEHLREEAVTPVLVTLPPLDAERHLHFIGKNEQGRQNILQWLGDVHMIYRFHEMYSRIVEKVAKQTNSILVDVRSRFLDKHNLRELLGLDGIHLSPAGYGLYQQVFADFIVARRRDPSRLVFE